MSEESLREAESMQRVLVESLGEGVGLFDAQGRAGFANQTLATVTSLEMLLASVAHVSITAHMRPRA